MATIRKLSDDDVRSIFECIHNNKAPPVGLKFQIVPIGPTGLALSPPSFEFEGKLSRRCCSTMTFHPPQLYRPPHRLPLIL